MQYKHNASQFDCAHNSIVSGIDRFHGRFQSDRQPADSI